MPRLTTTVYKYKRYAPWLLVSLVVSTMALFLFSPFLHPFINLAGIVGIFSIAIYAALQPKSIFSVRSADDRELVWMHEQLQWGTWLIPLDELDKLEVYIHGFDSFRYLTGHWQGRKSFTTIYGDRNTVHFVYKGISYDLTFYLGTFEHYDTLIQIMQCWKENGVLFSARSLFTDDYIREQVSQYG